MMPEVLKAFELAASMILGEDAGDRDMRLFHLAAERLSRAACKAKAGLAWDTAGAPYTPVPEYDAEAFTLRVETVRRFAKVEERHVRLMDDRLRRHRPLRFSPDMAPPGHVNSDEIRDRIVALNKEADDAASGFRSGAVTVRDLVASLDTADTGMLASLAGYLCHASSLYFEGGTVLATVERDDAGNVTSLDVPVPDERALQ